MRQWTLVLAGVLAAYLSVKELIALIRRRGLKGKAGNFLLKAHSQAPELAPVEKGKERLILASSAVQLAALIRSGSLSSLEIVSVFIQRACKLGRSLNLNAEEAFATALIQAAACDEAMKNNPKACGRLHGVPICVKDVFAEYGKATTCGVARLTENTEKEEAVVLQVLQAEGAILFLRGSVPQAVDWVETDNFLFGTGRNPWDLDRTCGGSAEAALVTCLCAPLAISADHKDSMQLACAFTGAYGFRPTPDRVSHLGLRHSHSSGISPYEWLYNTSVGPVARSAEDLALVCQLWWGDAMFKEDIAVPDLPFNDPIYQQVAGGKTLKVGLIRSNGLLDPVKGCSDRLEKAAETLRSLGYEVVDFPLPSVEELFRQVMASVHAFTSQAIKESLQGETPIAAYVSFANFILMRECGPIMRYLLRRSGNMRLHEHLKVPLATMSSQAITLYYLLRDWRIAFTKAWQSAGLDLVLCPSWPLPAPRHGEITETMLALTYTSLWSLLGFPVGILPTGPLNKPDLSYPDTVKDSITKGAQRHCEGAQGLPLALSVVGLPYMDEKVLGFLQVLERSGVARFLPVLH